MSYSGEDGLPLRLNKDLKRRRLDFEDDEEDQQVSNADMGRRRLAKRRRRSRRGASTEERDISPAKRQHRHHEQEEEEENDEDELGAPFTASLPPLSEEPEADDEEDDDLGIGANLEPEDPQEWDVSRRMVDDQEEEENVQEEEEDEEDDEEEKDGEMSSGLHDDFRSLYAEADRRRKAQKAREQEEDQRWREVIEAGEDFSWFTALYSKSKLREMVLKGVPARYRASLWRVLCYSHPYASQQRANGPSTFIRLLASPNVGKAVDQIRLDLERTLVDHAEFNAIPDRCAHLFDILKAYSYHNVDVGYCQGMAPVVGGLMTVVLNDDLITSNEDEDDMSHRKELIFWLLATMLDGHNLSRYYEPGMAGLIKDASVFHDVLAVHLPELSAHLDKYKLDSLMYMTPWFLSLYTHLPNWDLVLTVFDMFLVEGVSALFRFALAILEGCAEDLLSRNGLERILPYLLNVPTDKLRTDAVIQRAAALDIDRLLEEAYFKSQMPAPPAPAQLKGYPATPQRAGVPSTPSRAATDASATPAPSSSLFLRMFSAFPTPVRSKISLTSPFQPRTAHHQPHHQHAPTPSTSSNASSSLGFLSPFTARPVKGPRPSSAIIAASAGEAKPKPNPAAMRPTTPYPSAAKRPLMPPHQFHHQRQTLSAIPQSSSQSTRGSQTPMMMPSSLKRTRYQQQQQQQPLSPLRHSTSVATAISPAKRRRTEGWAVSPSAKKSPAARAKASPATTPRSAALRSLISSSASAAFMSPASSPLSPTKETPSRRPKKIRTKRTGAAKRRLDEQDKENSPNIKPSDDNHLKSFITPTKLRVATTNNTTPYKRARAEGSESSTSPAVLKKRYYFSPSKSPVVEGAIELKSIGLHQHKKTLFDD